MAYRVLYRSEPKWRLACPCTGVRMEADMATQPMRPPQKPRTAQSIFGDLPPAIVRELETISLTNHYPTGAVLFSEGMAPRGVYLVLGGLVILFVCVSDVGTLIVLIAN